MTTLVDEDGESDIVPSDWLDSSLIAVGPPPELKLLLLFSKECW